MAHKYTSRNKYDVKVGIYSTFPHFFPQKSFPHPPNPTPPLSYLTGDGHWLPYNRDSWCSRMTTKSKNPMRLLSCSVHNRHLCRDWICSLLIDYAFSRHLQFIINCSCPTAVMRRTRGACTHTMQLRYRRHKANRTAFGYLSGSYA